MNYGMTLSALLEGWLEDVPDIDVHFITQDPKKVRPGTLFVRVGKTPEAQANLQEAVSNGCSAVLHDVADPLSGLAVPTLALARLDQRLGELASRFWAAPSDLITVAAVAGNAGRVRVTHYLAQAWQRSCAKGAMIGSLGHGPVECLQPPDLASADVFGLNRTLAAYVDEGIERVAIEISPQSLQQGRCQTLQVDLALITGLPPDAGLDCAERRLLTEHAPTFAVVNYDDPRGRKWIDDFDESVELLSFGLDPAAELSARIVTMDRQGMSLRFSGPWGEANILTDLRGEAEARNLLSVAGALVLLGMDWSEACRQLEYVRPVPVDCSLRGTVIESDRALEQAA